MIVICGCNKGGAGKSTTATNIAIALAKTGADVCLVDADKQRSSAKWYGDRQDAGHQPELTLVEKYDDINKTLVSLDSRFDYVVVDVEGSNSRELITGAMVADVIIAPHQYSQFDIDTLEELQQQVGPMGAKLQNATFSLSMLHGIFMSNF